MRLLEQHNSTASQYCSTERASMISKVFTNSAVRCGMPIDKTLPYCHRETQRLYADVIVRRVELNGNVRWHRIFAGRERARYDITRRNVLVYMYHTGTSNKSIFFSGQAKRICDKVSYFGHKGRLNYTFPRPIQRKVIRNDALRAKNLRESYLFKAKA